MLANLHALILSMVSSAVVFPLIQKCEDPKTFAPIQPVGHLEPLSKIQELNLRLERRYWELLCLCTTKTDLFKAHWTVLLSAAYI